jgi:hypothetical protein
MKKVAIVVVVLLVGFCLASTAVTGAEIPSKDQKSIDLETMEILLDMAETLADAKQFSVEIRSSYDAPQEDGRMVEFRAHRKIQVKRPDSIRVDMMRSDGERRVTLFDGKQIVVQNLTEKVYSKVPYDGSLDEAIRYLVNDLQLTLPLARMFRTTLPDDMKRMVEEIDYVGEDILTAVPSHQLAVRTHDIDFQIWVGQGDMPLPLRVVITYKNAPGAPQFRADLDEWDFSDGVAKGPFIFEPEEDVEGIPLVVRRADGAVVLGQEGEAR